MPAVNKAQPIVGSHYEDDFGRTLEVLEVADLTVTVRLQDYRGQWRRTTMSLATWRSRNCVSISAPAPRAMLDKERRVVLRALFGSVDAALTGCGPSSRNSYLVTAGNRTVEAMVAEGWLVRGAMRGEIDRAYHVTAMGALAAGIADRARPEDLAVSAAEGAA